MSNSVENRWKIYQIAAGKIYVGNVVARDEKEAVRLAIKDFPVNNPEHQKLLVARKLEPIGAK